MLADDNLSHDNVCSNIVSRIMCDVIVMCNNVRLRYCLVTQMLRDQIMFV